MTSYASRTILNDAEITHLLNDIDGPVGQMLLRMAEDMARVARAKVRVREGNVWSEATTTARPPGFTKAGIHAVVGHSAAGDLFGSANAPADPTIFLEKRARQMHKAYPFLTTGLWSVTLL